MPLCQASSGPCSDCKQQHVYVEAAAANVCVCGTRQQRWINLIWLLLLLLFPCLLPAGDGLLLMSMDGKLQPLNMHHIPPACDALILSLWHLDPVHLLCPVSLLKSR